MPGSPKWPSPSCSLTKIVYAFLISPMHTPCSTHLTILNLRWRTQIMTWYGPTILCQERSVLSIKILCYKSDWKKHIGKTLKKMISWEQEDIMFAVTGQDHVDLRNSRSHWVHCHTSQVGRASWTRGTGPPWLGPRHHSATNK
jgi:hypothetical protein